MEPSVKKNIRLILGIAAILFLFFFIKGGVEGFTKHKEERRAMSEQYLLEMAAEENKNLPKMVATNVRLDRVLVEPGKKLVHAYTLTELAVSEADPKVILGARSELTRKTCTEMLDTLSKGVTLAFTYQDKAGRAVADFAIALADCGQN